MAWPTPSSVRLAIPRLASETAYPDSELQRMIDEAIDTIQSYCNRVFGPGTYTETLDSSGSGRLFLGQTPITAILSISTNPPDFDATLDLTTYRFDPATGEVRYGGSWFDPLGWGDLSPFWGACGWRSVRVVYTAGEAAPAAVTGVCLRMIARSSAALAANATLRSKSMGNVSYTYADPNAAITLTGDDRAILSRFKSWSL